MSSALRSQIVPTNCAILSFVYFVDSDVLHTGSVFRTNMYPIIDVYNGDTVTGMIENGMHLEEVLAADATPNQLA